MKLLIILFSIYSFSSFAFKPSDISLYTQTDGAWTLHLIKEAQKALTNMSYDVNLKRFVMENEVVQISDSEVESYVTDESRGFLELLEDISGLHFLKIKPEMSVSDIGYEISNFSPDIKVGEDGDGNIVLNTNIGLEGLNIFAKSFDVVFVMPNLVNGKKISPLEIKIKSPRISFRSGFALPINLDIKIIEENGKLRFLFPPVDMEELADTLLNSIDAFDFDFEEILISDISLHFMGRKISVNATKVEETIENNKENLKKIILGQISDIIRREGLQGILNDFEGHELANKYWFNQEDPDLFPMKGEIVKIKKHNGSLLGIETNFDFCTKRNFIASVELCHELSGEDVISRITAENNTASLFAVQEEFDKGAKMVLSASENVINKFIIASLEDGMWDETLDESGIKLGSNKAFVRFEEESDEIKLYVDVKYDIGAWRLLAKQKILNFPVVMKLKARVEKQNVVLDDGTITNEILPHLVFSITDVDLDHIKLRYGIAEEGLSSNLNSVRFSLRGMVVKEIQKQLLEYDYETNILNNSEWKGVDLPGLALSQFKNIDLSKLKIKIDGHGRANLIFMDAAK